MTHNERIFFDYWYENIKGKVHIPTRLLTESYFYYYGRPYMGATCGRCLSGVGQELKDIFNRLLKQFNDQQYIQEQLLIEQQLEKESQERDEEERRMIERDAPEILKKDETVKKRAPIKKTDNKVVKKTTTRKK